MERIDIRAKRTAESDSGFELLQEVKRFQKTRNYPIGNINFTDFIMLAQGGYVAAGKWGVYLTPDGMAYLKENAGRKK